MIHFFIYIEELRLNGMMLEICFPYDRGEVLDYFFLIWGWFLVRNGAGMCYNLLVGFVVFS